jgi:hypothetical protein
MEGPAAQTGGGWGKVSHWLQTIPEQYGWGVVAEATKKQSVPKWRRLPRDRLNQG